MESRDVLKIHGKLRRYCTSSVERSETREVQYLLNEEILKKNTSISGCIEKYISLVKMYKKIRNRKIYVKKKIIGINGWEYILNIL